LVSEKVAGAEMSERSAVPDITLMFGATRPVESNNEAAQRVFAIVLISSLAFALALAVLLDRLDKKFRYPDQATRDLGLTIIGTVPKIRRIRNWQADPSVAAGVVEAFRSVRMAIASAFPTGVPMTVAVSSAGISDGKSLVASNLALSLAEGGYRTLLIDGDIRRGELHSDFGIERRPGLLDHLAGRSPLADVIHPTTHPKLWMIPGGTRFRHGPELLMSPATKPMLDELKTRFDAIIVDTPPLSAGVDAYVLGVAMSNMLMVLRTGRSDRKLAEAKLDLLDRLPVRVLGTVLNGVNGDRAFQYYKYIDGYAVDSEEEESPLIPASSSGQSLTKRQG
jgi:capsular exopolysaccharide synthesis family protein